MVGNVCAKINTFGFLNRSFLLLVIFSVALSATVCRAEIPGGRFTPLRAEAESQSGTFGAVPDSENETVTVFADSVLSSEYTSVKPSTAMYHSLALAGWGQHDNRKKYKALMFIAAEAVCIGGIFYYENKLGDENLSSFDKDWYRTERNSFILYWMITKIYGIMDAYVDAHLATYDVSDITPEELER